MLYKNKIKVQNILKSAVALMLMLTLSLSTALSPLAKAEEAGYTWKTLTSAPVSVDDALGIYVNPDGSKLFIREEDSSHNTIIWMSTDDGATWRKIFSKQAAIRDALISTDGSKMVLLFDGHQRFYISTDGGQTWTERLLPSRPMPMKISPDGSFLAGCSISGSAYTTHISTDNGQTWTQKGTNNVSCPEYMFNNGTIIAVNINNKIAKSTDYGQTWTEISNFSNNTLAISFSNNGNTVFDGDRISLDGGNHWTPSNAPISANNGFITRISDDGKKLFIDDRSQIHAGIMTFHTSVDGGRTWRTENTPESATALSSDGSKLFRAQLGGHNNSYFVGTLPAAQPVTPGSGAGGTVAPSTASTSATPGQKPGKASGRLAETGTSTWMVGGLAVVAVAAGALVLRKRL